MRNNVVIEYNDATEGLNLKFVDARGGLPVALFQTGSESISVWNQLNILNFIRDGILPVLETK